MLNLTNHHHQLHHHYLHHHHHLHHHHNLHPSELAQISPQQKVSQSYFPLPPPPPPQPPTHHHHHNHLQHTSTTTSTTTTTTRIEGPSIFLGRGPHPLSGRLKGRILPEDVTINCTKDKVFSPTLQAPPYLPPQPLTTSPSHYLPPSHLSVRGSHPHLLNTHHPIFSPLTTPTFSPSPPHILNSHLPPPHLTTLQVPEPPEGHRWGGVQHNHKVTHLHPT